MSMLTARTVAVVLTLGVIHSAASAADEAAQAESAPQYLETPAGEKPRVVITADPELDDSNSLVRYLLYTTDFRTEGLIYASSQFHWTGDGKGTTLSVPGREYTRFGLNLCPCTSWRWDQREKFIDDAIAAYAEAFPNLRVHNADYPTPVELKSKVRWGNVEFDGDISKDTPGSDLIKSLLLDEEEAPIYLHAWGGMSTIARALKSIEDEYGSTPRWAEIRAKVIRKAVIHPSGDQDDTYANYIKPHWPEIRYRQQSGSVPLSYNAQGMVSEADAAYFTARWTRENITNRGPLGGFYRVWGDGKQMVEGDIFDYFGIPDKSAQELRDEGYIVWTPPHGKGEFLGEGDTGTFINLIDNGLRGYRGDSFGGWGGYASDRPLPAFFGGDGLTSPDAIAADPLARPAVPRAPTHPFLAATQRDFAARFAWATTPGFADANHNPKIEIDGPHTVTAKVGQQLSFNARTSDPDGDAVTLKWWRWDEADSYTGKVALKPAGTGISLKVPGNAKPGDTIQIIAEATDNGSPALTRYEKVAITISD